MHIMATCLCFWFGTIVEDALEDYHHKLEELQKKQINKSISLTGNQYSTFCLSNIYAQKKKTKPSA